MLTLFGEKMVYSKGWEHRCSHAKSGKCTCQCGGANHGKDRMSKVNTKSTKQRKPKKPSDATTQAMYLAVAKYIKELGGSAAVIGGVSVMKKPEDLKFNYSLVINITGQSPVEPK